ncbi:MAG TPA: hypothetical protein VE377_20735 [Candidatus Dormibacteraeota bacterium]|nr:hypothetical protein [Candidatus Dormibacteraeota bacterium]
MRSSWACLLALPLIATTCTAQSDKPCVAGRVATLSDRDGVTTKTVSFTGKFGRVTAHVFLPDTAEPVPGIAFSYSSIQYEDSLTDLRPFARALARAGAASIMLDGTIDWHTPNDDFKRPWAEFNCAAKWLMASANLDPERLAIGGPIQFGHELPFCPSETERTCDPWIYVNYGWDDPMAIRATKLMKTPHSQLHVTNMVTGGFHLKDVELAWLLEEAGPAAVAQR